MSAGTGTLDRRELYGRGLPARVLLAVSWLCEILPVVGGGAIPQSPGWALQSRIVRNLMIIAVTGLAREARLIASPDVRPVIGGGDATALEQRLMAELANGARRILSIGICGALCPALRVGDAIIASEIVDSSDSYPTHGPWSRDLASRLPHAVLAPLAG